MTDAGLDARLEAAALVGMTSAVWADVRGDARAVRDPDGTWRSFADVNARANQLARLLRARGLRAGDGVALICSNRVKAPRSLDFATDLPRSEAGKIQRGKVRAPYWARRERQI